MSGNILPNHPGSFLSAFYREIGFKYLLGCKPDLSLEKYPLKLLKEYAKLVVSIQKKISERRVMWCYDMKSDYEAYLMMVVQNFNFLRSWILRKQTKAFLTTHMAKRLPDDILYVIGKFFGSRLIL